jgi:biotin operon repressor
MPTPPHRDEVTAASPLTETQAKLLAYLRERTDGPTYLKSKYVADELGLSSKEVGTNMSVLQDRVSGIEIEQWGRSSSTTWRVTG